jgi:hypothetical protein
MPKQLTAKDVLYALEYLHERLTLNPDGKWSLEPSRQRVSPHVADEAKAHGGVVGRPDRSGCAVYVWQAAA